MKKKEKDQIMLWSSILSGLYIIYSIVKDAVGKMTTVNLADVVIGMIFLVSLSILIKGKINEKLGKLTPEEDFTPRYGVLYHKGQPYCPRHIPRICLGRRRQNPKGGFWWSCPECDEDYPLPK